VFTFKNGTLMTGEYKHTPVEEQEKDKPSVNVVWVPDQHLSKPKVV